MGKWQKSLLGLIVPGVLVFGVAACGDRDSAEQVGEDIDEVFEENGDLSDGPFENAGEAIDEAREDAEDAVEDAVEDAKNDAQN